MPTDIEIANAAQLLPINQVATGLALTADEYEPYGPYIAKIPLAALKCRAHRPDGRLVLVTAMTPTPAGEGKTTTTVGLSDALAALGKKAMVCLREPSMGPCFGVKGGAAGGGRAMVVPMDAINLHFTGDLHAVGAAHNLLAALLDNHLHQGNALGLDPRKITLRRVLDMNDRALRSLVIGLGGPASGVPRESGFDITVSSEVMACLCLADGLTDLKRRLGNILIGMTTANKPIYARDLGAHGAMAAILKDAIKPNLVQTLAHTPALVHGGPFANIAHGCNSLLATRLALKLADIVVTEAGFATDLGAEKFFDIKCRVGGLKPGAVVLVATVRALKYHGGVPKADLANPAPHALAAGFHNLEKHIENIRAFGLPLVVAVNRFASDTQAEIAWVLDAVRQKGVPTELSTVHEKGAEGGADLARCVLGLLGREDTRFDYLYPLEMPLIEKMNVVARCMYGADGVDLLKSARQQIEQFEALGFKNLPICMAKTQHSLSDNAGLLGRPHGFKITIKNVRLCAGAGFLVAEAGDIMTMPGLPKEPAASRIDVDDDGHITGLF